MNKLILISFWLLFFSASYANKDTKVFKSIEFKDLKYLSKYEIIDMTDIRIRDNNIIIDINSLERALNDMPLVGSYKISIRDQRLIVSVVENRPVFSLAVREGEKNLLLELDQEFRPVSINRIHGAGLPLVIVTPLDFKENKISSRLRTFLNLISSLNKNNLEVIKEIREIDYTGISGVRILLKGRRTVFIFRPGTESFNRLNCVTGYFDRIKYYPHTFTILNNEGILE